MAADYDSKLISRLYRSDDDDQISEILMEMREIANPIFVSPIFDKYEELVEKDGRSWLGHYFVGTLYKISSPEALAEIEKIFNRTGGGTLAFREALEVFGNEGIFEPDIIKRAQDCLTFYFSKRERGEEAEDGFKMGVYLNYLAKGKALHDFSEKLEDIFFSESIYSVGERTTALAHFLRLQPSKSLQSILNKKVTLLSSESTQIILAKELSGWKGAKVEELRLLIKSQGESARAKEIIEKQIGVKQEEVKKEEQEENIIHGNIQVVTEISVLRKKINDKTEAAFKVRIFEDTELLILQSTAATDEPEFKVALTGIRAIIQAVSPNAVAEGLSPEEIEKYLGSGQANAARTPLNRLYIYLASKGADLGMDLFGLRRLQRICSLLGAHPEEEARGLVELKELDSRLHKLHSDEKYRELHKEVLVIYKNCLEQMLQDLGRLGL